jgi:hypothetical protein
MFSCSFVPVMGIFGDVVVVVVVEGVDDGLVAPYINN